MTGTLIYMRVTQVQFVPDMHLKTGF